MEGIEKRRPSSRAGTMWLVVLGFVVAAIVTPQAGLGSVRDYVVGFGSALTRPAVGDPADCAASQAPWLAHLAEVDRALSRHDVSGAVRTWHDAYGAALGSRRWQAMIEVGDAFRRIGEEAGTRDGARPNARQAYLLALVRARRDGSVEGVRRAALAFAALGDVEVARQCDRLADRMERRG